MESYNNYKDTYFPRELLICVEFVLVQEMCVLIFLYFVGRYYFGYISKMESVDYPELVGVVSPYSSTSLIV